MIAICELLQKKKLLNFCSISGRSHGIVNESEAKARTDCVESNQSKECSVAGKSHGKVNVQHGGAVVHPSVNHKLRQGQHQHQHQHQQQHQQPHKNTILRRKTVINKQKVPQKAEPTPKPQQQVINRARGTLHGLSTIKRHGNVRVT